MVKYYPSITEDLRGWCLQQSLFFVASAPLTGAHINCSPKGLPSRSLAILNPNQVAYIDANGSGNETISHIYENGRVTVMFCSFGTSPRILRFFCRGRVVEKGDAAFEEWMSRMGEGKQILGARAIIVLDIFKVQTSCGFGVPIQSVGAIADATDAALKDDAPSIAIPKFSDRDTMHRWAVQRLSTGQLENYQKMANSDSLDGLPGLRSAMRSRGRWFWVASLRARSRRLLGQWDALLTGGILTVLSAVSMAPFAGASFWATVVGAQTMYAVDLPSPHSHRQGSINSQSNHAHHATKIPYGLSRAMELRRRYVISAAIFGVVSWALVAQWAPSLVYLPYAFLAGVATTILAAGWVLVSTSRGIERRARKKSLQKSHAAFTAPGVWEAEKALLWRRSRYKREPLYPASFVVSDSLDGILELVLRDFVSSWYGKISPRPAFPNQVDRAVRTAMIAIRDRVLEVDIVDVVVSRMLPIITAHLKDFYDAEQIIRGRKLSKNVTESEELDLAIAGKYRDGKLHPAASLGHSNTKLVQQQHLRGIVTRLLPMILPAHMTTSTSVTILIREIVACAVLTPLMQLLADPDTWNQLLEAYGRTMLQDRKSVRKLRAALDEHAPATPKSQRAVRLPKLTPQDHERKFERFIRAIRQCNSLSDARRFRSEVASQLKKESAVENQDPAYLRRLDTGKRILDQRVAFLGAGGSTAAKPHNLTRPIDRSHGDETNLKNASLRDVLYDATGLSYFMEYMDRMKLMRLVQFWIVVDGFRNPLEEDTDEPDGSVTSKTPWSTSDRMDLAQIYEGYLSKPELHVAGEHRDSVREFLRAGTKASPAQYHAARRAVLQAQMAVYEAMQEPSFLNFKKSDLFFKWLASHDAMTASTKIPAPTLNGLEIPAENAIASRPQKPSVVTRSLSTSQRLAPRIPELQRAVASSADLRGKLQTADVTASSRRSLDDSSTRAPLFDDDPDTDLLARSAHSVDPAQEQQQNGQNEEHIVDAMQAALDDIMEDGRGQHDLDRSALFSESIPKSPHEDHSARSSMEISRPTTPALRKDRDRPSIASLGLVGAPSRLGVFSDDLFGDEEEKFLEDEHDDDETNEHRVEDEIHEAAPGDLGLAEAIDTLTIETERLIKQDSIVDSLMNKAELTNNAAELRILRKSKVSLQREIHRKELQRQQYIVQESDNSLYGRANVSIKSIMVGNDEEGREFALYVIEVRRQAGEQMTAAAWVIARRYSEFHELNKQLRAKYPSVRNLDFPRRQVVLKLQKDMLQKRRASLERWLRELLLMPAICRSRELRAFLSQRAISSATPTTQANTNDFVTRIYNSVTDGMEEFLGNIPVLDQLSLAGQNLISAATSQLNASSTSPTTAVDGSMGGPVSSGPVPASATISMVSGGDEAEVAQAEAELAAFDTHRELEPFVKPICDLFLEAFGLNRERNWLRGRAVVVVLHQLLGGTIERKVRDNVKLAARADSVVRYLALLRDAVWPAGVLRKPLARTAAEREASRKEAGLLLATMVPEAAGSVVGRQNAQAASRRISATMNNQRLNTHLVFTILDEVVDVVFGEPTAR